MLKGVLVQPQAREIDPHEIGALGFDDGYAGQALAEEGFEKPVVPFQVGQQLLQPFLAVIVGGLDGRDTEGIQREDAGASDGLLKGLPECRVGDHHVRRLQRGEVEGLAGRGADDRPRLVFGTQRGVWREVPVPQDQVAVDLVGHDQHVVVHADPAEAPQLLAGPDASDRVVGMAEDGHPDLRIGAFGFEIVEVHVIPAVPVLERVQRRSRLQVLDGVVEGIVYRRLHQHFVAGFRVGRDQHVQGGYDARGEADGVGIDGPVMAPLHPPHHGIIVGRRREGVSVDAHVRDFGHGVHHRLRARKVHVRHPQRKHGLLVPAGVGLVPGDNDSVPLHIVPLVRIGSVAIDTLVEIIVHREGNLHRIGAVQ